MAGSMCSPIQHASSTMEPLPHSYLNGLGTFRAMSRDGTESGAGELLDRLLEGGVADDVVEALRDDAVAADEEDPRLLGVADVVAGRDPLLGGGVDDLLLEVL